MEIRGGVCVCVCVYVCVCVCVRSSLQTCTVLDERETKGERDGEIKQKES